MPVPFLIWAAVRLRPFGTANALLLVAVVSMLSAIRGTGVFWGNSSNEVLLSMQLFLLLVAVSLMCLAILIAERETRTRELRESEARFRLVADAAPMPIWMSGADTLGTFFSKTWLDFTGRLLGQELGTGWSDGMHPDDQERCLETYAVAFDARQEFEVEYRLRRHDGEFRWVVSRGVPRFESDGAFCGYIGSCIDVTERKRSEQRLQELSGRLIDAQEEERARIARELHDDLSQRMALLEMSTDRLRQRAAGLWPDASRELVQIAEATAQISSDIRHLSHRLHPSTLGTLGLAAAVKGLCREISEQFGLKVRFVPHDVPDRLAIEVSTCIFRIVQESLRNVVKHGGGAEATVELSGAAGRVELCVLDTGAGFDPDVARHEPGLGLISMRERLRSIGGTLQIESAPSVGTRIRVSTPVDPRFWSPLRRANALHETF